MDGTDFRARPQRGRGTNAAWVRNEIFHCGGDGRARHPVG